MVNAYQTSKIFINIGDKILSVKKEIELKDIREWLAEMRDSNEHREMLDMAILVREIARRGDSEREMCREVLEAVLKFSDRKNETSYLSF